MDDGDCIGHLPKDGETLNLSDIERARKHLSLLDQILERFSEAPLMIVRQHHDGNLWKETTIDSGTGPSLEAITAAYAPRGLEHQFQQLYRILHPCLVQWESRTNGSAFLQGTRGSGKSLVLDRCLQACRDELDSRGQRHFRVVTLNGILIPGRHVSLVVTEILLQLSALAWEETTTPNRGNQETLQEMLRLKRSSFTNNIQLLNEALQMASVDGIPFLFVLDELDAFLQEERQVLLYHLLDRVATSGSFVSFVGISCNHEIFHRLEKRIRSRAEGTSKFINFGPCSTYQELVDIVLEKAKGYPSLRQQLKEQILLDHQANTRDYEQSDKRNQMIAQALERDHRMGNDVRSFIRYFNYALSLYRFDCCHQLERLKQYTNSTDSESQSVPLPFTVNYLLEAMLDMGASFLVSDTERDVVMVEDSLLDARIRALCDMSGPQVALMLGARRILVRDGLRREGDQTQPLTFERMIHEYHTSFVRNFGSGVYSRDTLTTAFRELLSVGLLRPSADHSGRLPLQYWCQDPTDEAIFERVPLHLMVDINRELDKALENNWLQGSTVLLEWGKKIN